MNTLLWRDLRLALRNPRGWVMSVIFFVLFLSVMAIALGGNTTKLRPLAPPLIWMALLFGQLLTFPTIFQRDIVDGTYEQLHLSGISGLSITTSKMISCFVVSICPLLLAIPALGIGYGLDKTTLAAILLSVILGGPAIIAYGIFSGSIVAKEGNAGFLVILIALPFLVPVLIFALGGIASYRENGLWNLEFQALSGISLIAIAAAIPATAATLSSYQD